LAFVQCGPEDTGDGNTSSINYSYSHLLVDAVFLEVSYPQLSVRKRRVKRDSSVLSFESVTVDFTCHRSQCMRYRSQNSTSVSVTTMLRSTSKESHGASFIPCLFFYPRHEVPYGKLRFLESLPFGRGPTKRIGFQLTQFELTTDRFRRVTIMISADAISINNKLIRTAIEW